MGQKQLFTDAYGWNDAREEELLNARYYYDTKEIVDTIDLPYYLDITDGTPGGLITTEYPYNESHAA